MSQALHKISRSPFFEEIENLDPPRRFVRPAFVIYNGKSNLVEHMSHFNHSMALYTWNEALMCKVFPSSLGPTAMKWFNSYEELTKAFSSRFVTCNGSPNLSTPF